MLAFHSGRVNEWGYGYHIEHRHRHHGVARMRHGATREETFGHTTPPFAVLSQLTLQHQLYPDLEMMLPDQPSTRLHSQIISQAPSTTPAITANDTALSLPLPQGSTTLPLPTKLEPGGRVILRGLMDNHGKHEPSAWSSSSMQVANSCLNLQASTAQKANLSPQTNHNTCNQIHKPPLILSISCRRHPHLVR